MPEEEWWERLSAAEKATVRLLARLEQHTLLKKLGDALADVSHVVHEMAAPGEITLKVKITQPSPGQPTTAITVGITKKMPGHKPMGQFAFYQDGLLTDWDPRQLPMPEGRTVEREAEARTVAARRESIRRIGNSDGD